MENGKYWEERFRQLEEAQNKQALAAFQQIEQQYTKAQKEIEGKIAMWYLRFAENNNISMAEARRWLLGKELKEFKWDVQEYIKYGRENAVNQQWLKQLENASARYHISRLEALKVHLQQSLEVMFGNKLDILDSYMRNIYTDGYYHTLFEIEKGVGVKTNFALVDERKINRIISKPWAADGYNFSERIWKNKDKLIQEVHNELTQNIMLGSDPQKAIDAIAKKMNTSKNNAGRLVMTEEAYFSSVSQQEAFNELDVEQYRIAISYDEKTCDICQRMEGKVFSMVDYKPGTTAHPFHVYCRCCTVPYFDDEFSKRGTKAARDKNGKTIFIPKNMSYQDWKKEHNV